MLVVALQKHCLCDQPQKAVPFLFLMTGLEGGGGRWGGKESRLLLKKNFPPLKCGDLQHCLNPSKITTN